MPFLLTIRKRGKSRTGWEPIATTFSSEESAQADLLTYVRANWDAKMGGTRPKEEHVRVSVPVPLPVSQGSVKVPQVTENNLQ